MPTVVRTIRDRIAPHPALDALARLSFSIERDMHIAMLGGATYADLKGPLAQRHGTTVKHVEMIRDVLQGRVDSLVEGAKLNAVALRRKITAKRKDVTRRLTQVTKARNAIAREERRRTPDPGIIAAHRRAIRIAEAALHQHNRRIGVLEAKLSAAEARIARPVLCFGSRDLLRRRAALDLPKAVRAAHIASWRREWDRRRGGEIMLAGAAAYECGNQFVRIRPVEDHGIVLGWDVILRLPAALAAHADRTFWSGGVEVREAVVGRVRFSHGHEAFAAALARGGAPVSWRFQRDESHDGSWQVRCTFRDDVPEVRDPTFTHGALGIDFNADHLALSLTDGRGCFVHCCRIPLDVTGLSSAATLYACRRAAKRVAAIAFEHHVPVVTERLDFAKRKAELRNIDGPARARALHALAYATFGAALESACARAGVRLKRVNPAYTSTMRLRMSCEAAWSIGSSCRRRRDRAARPGVLRTTAVHGEDLPPCRRPRHPVATRADRAQACVGVVGDGRQGAEGERPVVPPGTDRPVERLRRRAGPSYRTCGVEAAASPRVTD